MDPRRGDQVGIHQSDALIVQFTGFHHMPDFADCSSRYPRQRIEKKKTSLPIAQGTQGQFRNNKRVHHNASSAEQLSHGRIVGAKVIDPNGRIRKITRLLGDAAHLETQAWFLPGLPVRESFRVRSRLSGLPVPARSSHSGR